MTLSRQDLQCADRETLENLILLLYIWLQKSLHM